MRLPGRYYRVKHRTVNALRDLIDKRVRGLCCQDLTIDDGGYSHWRCGRPAGHPGEHRFRNYVWQGPGHRTEFDPVPGHDCDCEWGRTTMAGGLVSTVNRYCERHRYVRVLKDLDRYPSKNRRQREAYDRFAARARASVEERVVVAFKAVPKG